MNEVCACIGPLNGEPYCQCQMIFLGLKTEEEYNLAKADREKLKSVLGTVFQWDGPYGK